MTTTGAGRRLTEVVTPQDAEARVRSEGAVLVDVRGFDEFATGHAPGAICIPLPDLERRAGELPRGRPILVTCQSGGRSALAAARLRGLGLERVWDVQGGFNAWRRAGLPSVRQTRAIPLERQVRITAGILVSGFCLAGGFVSPAFFWGAALVGFLLVLTGALGICPMMSVLNLLPWNRVGSEVAPDGK